MSQFVETPTRTFTAAAAIGQYLRVKDNGSAKLAVAGASDLALGQMEVPATAADQKVAVRLRTAQGSCKMVANGAISAYATCYAAASGKIAATGTVIVGTLLADAATADGDVVEGLPLFNAHVSSTITGT